MIRLAYLEQTYWRAWEASKGERSSRRVQRVVAAAEGSAEVVQATIHTDETVGDKKWLEGVQWCIEKRAEILGLNAPERAVPIQIGRIGMYRRD